MSQANGSCRYLLVSGVFPGGIIRVVLVLFRLRLLLEGLLKPIAALSMSSSSSPAAFSLSSLDAEKASSYLENSSSLSSLPESSLARQPSPPTLQQFF